MKCSQDEVTSGMYSNVETLLCKYVKHSSPSSNKYRDLSSLKDDLKHDQYTSRLAHAALVEFVFCYVSLASKFCVFV